MIIMKGWIIFFGFLAVVFAYVFFTKSRYGSFSASFRGLLDSFVDVGVFRISLGLFVLCFVVGGLLQAESSIANAVGIIWFLVTVTGIAAIVIRHVGLHRGKKNCSGKNPLRPMPLPTDAREILEVFCRMMQALDSAMPFCDHEGKGVLAGGIDTAGNGYVRFWYDKDWAFIQTVFNQMGYDIKVSDGQQSDGWYIDGSSGEMVHLHIRDVNGYPEWSGAIQQKQNGQDETAAERDWEQKIKATIQNNWPNAAIRQCDVKFQSKGGDTSVYYIKVTT